MKKQILDFFKKHRGQILSARDLLIKLQIPKSQKREFRRLLKTMAAENKLARFGRSRYSLAEDVPTLTGTLKVHADGYGFVLPDDSKETDVFIPARFMGGALQSDTVVVNYIENPHDGRREGQVVEILKRGRSVWIGRFEKRGKSHFVINDEFAKTLEIFIPDKKTLKAKDGQIVSVALDEEICDGSFFQGEVVRIIGEPGDEDVQTKLILARYNIPEQFDKQVLKKAGSLKKKISAKDIAGRVDLRDLPIMTIDGVNARDFDDAVYVKKVGRSYHLYVAIADVAHYVKVKDTIDQEALRRGTSVYLPDFVVPMLPEELSNDLCSLKPNEDRLTVTCEMKLSEAGVLKEAWFYNSIIRSHKRATYEEVQSFLDGGELETGCPEIHQSLNLMKKLADKLMHRRRLRGSLDFDLPEAEVLYDHEGKIKAIVKAQRFFSHRLIEEFMILANTSVAAVMSRQAVPQLFRVHEFPEPFKIGEYLDTLKNLKIKNVPGRLTHPQDFADLMAQIKDHPLESFLHFNLLRCLKWAHYTADNRGHFGLSLGYYSHFTSPIRRYPDLVVHRQLKALIAKYKSKKAHLVFDGKWAHVSGAKSYPAPRSKAAYKDIGSGFEDCEAWGKQASDRERAAMEAERDMMDYKRAAFMQDHFGDSFSGSIKRIARFGVFVELTPHFVVGLLPLSELTDDYYVFDDKKMELRGRRRKKRYRINDLIQVQLKDISLDKGTIELCLAD